MSTGILGSSLVISGCKQARDGFGSGQAHILSTRSSGRDMQLSMAGRVPVGLLGIQGRNELGCFGLHATNSSRIWIESSQRRHALGSGHTISDYTNSEDKCEIAKNVTELIGNTPMVYLNHVVEGCVARVAANLETIQPCSNRIGYGIIKEAEEENKLNLEKKVLVVRCNYDNTAIALASAAAAKGYKLKIIFDDTMRKETKTILRAFGVELIHKNVEPDIERDINNHQIHLASKEILGDIGLEIWNASGGKADILISSIGTYDTVTGVYGFQYATVDGKEPGTHPKAFDFTIILGVIQVTTDEAIEMARQLVRKEGLLVGISSGAAAVAAIRLAKRPENAGKLIVAVFPSGGERDLSTEMFDPFRD